MADSSASTLLAPDFCRLTAIAVESLVRLEASLSRQAQLSRKPEYHAILTKILEVCRGYKTVFFEHVDIFRKALVLLCYKRNNLI